MFDVPHNPYNRWRTHVRPDMILNDGGMPETPNERFLQQIWRCQRIHRENLRTADGQSLRILHPGFWNHESGPDFREAVIQVGSSAPVVGDIEIDLHPHNWKDHHHHNNPAYKSVVLHVVWQGESRATSGRPLLVLKQILDAPLSDLQLWLDNSSEDNLAVFLKGKCNTPLDSLPFSQVAEILRQASLSRLHAKAAHLEARARIAGWEQALWEGMFGALGFKHNSWPMRRIAELLPELTSDERKPESTILLQAKLFGVSGLLPGQISRENSQGDRYLRQIWDLWWRERERLDQYIVPTTAWHLSGIRPANHPHRRLALAAHWVSSGDIPKNLKKWCIEPISAHGLAMSLLQLLQGSQDEFWSWHHTLRSGRLGESKPLLGLHRTTDLAMNVILPWFWARAGTGSSEDLRRMAESRYLAWPAGQDNAILRLARTRLFGGRRIRGLNKASLQQGILQVVRDFCSHSNLLCESCQFPSLVKHFNTQEH